MNEALSNIKIISAKALRFREIKDVDIVIVDEAHRLYTDSLDKAERWVKKAKSTCLFSYDADHMKIIRTFSYLEKRSDYLFYLSIPTLIVRNENSHR